MFDPEAIRCYYRALGIALPDRSGAEMPARCFANPDAHQHNDATPSCSVNVLSGAFYCHGCGARGGLYHAALAAGHTPRSAIELMISHGLKDEPAAARRPPSARTKPAHAPARASARPSSTSHQPASLRVTDEQVRRFHAALAARPALIARLHRARGWQQHAIDQLELGFDRGRITIPIRNRDRSLRGLLRYQPWRRADEAKMLCEPGTRLGMVPHPATIAQANVVIVEGPPDLVAIRSLGHDNTIALPGTEAWQSAWATLLAGRHVTIIMDADLAGRRAARRIAQDLDGHAHAEILDIAPSRDDGYDLTDWIAERPGHAAAQLNLLTTVSVPSLRRLDPPMYAPAHV